MERLMMRNYILVVMVLVLTGCATKVTRLGNGVYPATEPSSVKVFATQKPTCDLEEIGLIVGNLKWNQERAVEDAKIKAAKIGATHIQVTSVYSNLYNDAAVRATAYRCKQ
jgi:hypothetical protein